MKGILLRVGCDCTQKGGNWNAPMKIASGEYAYVPITGNEESYDHICECPTYALFSAAVNRLGVSMPKHLTPRTKVHLDPDFSSLTFGEPHHDARGRLSSRGETIHKLDKGDFIAFFAGFQTVERPRELAYCLFGIIHVKEKTLVGEVPEPKRQICAHGRRSGAEKDLVVWGEPETSGRFSRAIPIGEYRDRAYRVKRDILTAWGGLGVNDGYIQRSARPPFFTNPQRFLEWLEQTRGDSALLHTNW